MNDKKEARKLDTREKVAAISSLVIIAVVVVYWGVQISGVMEMLELAYG